MQRANVRSLDQNDDLRLSNYDFASIASPQVNWDGSLNPHTAPEEIALAII